MGIAWICGIFLLFLLFIFTSQISIFVFLKDRIRKSILLGALCVKHSASRRHSHALKIKTVLFGMCIRDQRPPTENWKEIFALWNSSPWEHAFKSKIRFQGTFYAELWGRMRSWSVAVSTNIKNRIAARTHFSSFLLKKSFHRHVKYNIWRGKWIKARIS